MKHQILFFLLLSLCFFIPVEADARKKRRLIVSRKWSISIVNGWTFAKAPKDATKETSSTETWDLDLDGQMLTYFSSLEISRNFGYYEIGAKIQQTGFNFVSPFFTWNIFKNNSKALFIPSLTVGITPFHVFGGWMRAGLGLSFSRYFSATPFVGFFAWRKITSEISKVNAKGRHWNTGIRISLYY